MQISINVGPDPVWIWRGISHYLVPHLSDFAWGFSQTRESTVLNVSMRKRRLDYGKQVYSRPRTSSDAPAEEIAGEASKCITCSYYQEDIVDPLLQEEDGQKHSGYFQDRLRHLIEQILASGMEKAYCPVDYCLQLMDAENVVDPGNHFHWISENIEWEAVWEMTIPATRHLLAKDWQSSEWPWITRVKQQVSKWSGIPRIKSFLRGQTKHAKQLAVFPAGETVQFLTASKIIRGAQLCKNGL